MEEEPIIEEKKPEEEPDEGGTVVLETEEQNIEPNIVEPESIQEPEIKPVDVGEEEPPEPCDPATMNCEQMRDKILDLSWLHNDVKDCYSADHGRPGIDPESALRLMLAGFFEGIVHDRKLMRTAQVNIAINNYIKIPNNELKSNGDLKDEQNQSK